MTVEGRKGKSFCVPRLVVGRFYPDRLSESRDCLLLLASFEKNPSLIEPCLVVVRFYRNGLFISCYRLLMLAQSSEGDPLY